MEDIKRLAFNCTAWWNSIHSISEADFIARSIQYEKAVTLLPRSYKLWHAYLKERRDALANVPFSSKKIDLFFQTYERALIYMNKMPRIWYVIYQ
jgi:pre-mRNA-splicing factor SYF1